MMEEFDIQIEVGELLDVADHILAEEGQHWVSPTYLCRDCIRRAAHYGVG